MALNVGVNVIETDGRASPTIQGAATSVAAFLGRAERGVPNRPVRVSTNEQLQSRFGNALADSYLTLAVRGFFLNGGREAYICRVVGAGTTPAFAALNNRAAAPQPALRVTAGYRGSPDPGNWGNNIRIDVQDDPRGATQLRTDTGVDATSADLVSIAGFQVGSVVRFVDGATTEYRRVTTVDAPNRRINWTGAVSPVLNRATTRVTTAEFRLLVRYRPTPTSDFLLVEEWPSLSMETDSPDYAIGRINNQFTGSRYILVTDLSGGAASGLENPAVASNQALAGSVESAPAQADYAGDQALRTGLFAFDTTQVQLLAIPDAHTLTTGRDAVVRAALDYCAARGDCMFVGAAPDRGASTGVTPRALRDYTQLESDYLNSIRTYSGQFQANKVFGALYAPWIRVSDPAAAGPDPSRFIPPDGHVMGVYARTEQERGIFKAPAGLAAQVRGALAVSADFTEGQHTDLVRNALVNGVRFTPGSGVTIAASRTLSTDTRWWFVNVRLLFNFVKSSLRDGLRFVRQEPHSEQLRKMVRFNVVTPFLLGLWRQGAFGSDPPAQVFTVKCDAENNPPAEVDLGNFRLEVYFYPAKPAETIIIVVGQQPSGAAASEA